MNKLRLFLAVLIVFFCSYSNIYAQLKKTTVSEIKAPWLATQPKVDASNVTIPLQRQDNIQVIVIPHVPKILTFAGEKVPLEYFDVRESLQRELTLIMYLHSTLAYTIQLSGRYKTRIISILEKEGVPQDFFYLCVAESTLQPLTSSVGARGYWQFIESAGKENGLIISSEIDERYNVDKATVAACKYLKKAKEKFGNWTLAAASYNIGYGSIQERMKTQSTSSYYDMQLPEETARYVYKALAFKLIMTNPRKYGYKINRDDYFKPIKTHQVTITGGVESWSDFAIKNGTNFKLLKICNEWIRSNKLVNREGKTYTVEVPDSSARRR